ncbi:MAG: hypothetical protein EOO24_42565 [Comamonadaceae bacterium]|nr:MAG: hypothetical protein EOO24_42565 [Comamonadaceae bacterium]
MIDGVRLLPSELEDALTELVVRGRAHCDSYAGLRALLVPAARRAGSASARRGRRAPLFGIADAGRWTLIRTPPPEPAEGGAQVAPATAHRGGEALPVAVGPRPAASADRARAAVSGAPVAKAATSPRSSPAASGGPASRAQVDAVEQVARILLRRYGVVCWRLLEREAAWLPAWRDIVRACRRLEARGELRGGRFIAGVSGEQFALPEAVAQMRQVRKQPGDGALLLMSAADPANLLGTLMPGARVPRVAGARIVWQDGVPLATVVAGELVLLAAVDDATRAQVAASTSSNPRLRAMVAVNGSTGLK